MISDSEARSLLQEAGQDIVVAAPDAASLIARRHARQRRRLVLVSGAAVVGLVVGGGVVMRPGGGEDPGVVPSVVGSRTAPVINTWENPSDLMMEARVGGELSVSNNGCLIVSINGRVSDVVWPYGFTVGARPDGTVVVRDAAGRNVVAVGTAFSAAGGWIPTVHNLACRASPPGSEVVSVDGEITSPPQ